MSEADSVTEAEAESDAPDEVRAQVWEDWLLQYLVGMANRTGVKFGITLSVGGLLVSGLLVSGEDYMEGLAATFELGDRLPDDFFGKTMGEAIRSYKEPYRRPDPDDPEDPLRKNFKRLPTFIHIENAQTWSPGTPQPTPINLGNWWRGKISSVDGFWLGVIETSK